MLSVFHQPEMTARFCTRVIAIRHGRVVYDGAPELSQRQLQDIYGSELDQVLRPPAPALPTDTLPEPEAAVGAASAA